MRRSFPGWLSHGTAAAVLLAILAVGCTGPPRGAPADPARSALIRLAPGDLPGFADDIAFDGLARAARQSRRYLDRLAPDTPFIFGPDTYSAAHLKESLDRFLQLIRDRPDTARLRRQIAAEFCVYKSPGRWSSEGVLFTGYYEPVLKGSLQRTEVFRYPVYARPDDLVEIDLSRFSDRYPDQRLVGRLDGRTVVPYYDRKQIESEGALAGKARVLAWIRDPVDLFFLQIQGSGRIVMTDARAIEVHYDGKNGRPYRSIGRLLIDRGEIDAEAMSMQAIRAWLGQHPDQVETVLNSNPSYVFFHIVENGPLGCLNVPLTPGRSVATDRRLFPMGALAYVRTRQPLVDGSGQIRSWQPLERFVLNQDTGGAIRGAGRADLFFGQGPYAETAAGHLKHHGDLFFLVLRPPGDSK